MAGTNEGGAGGNGVGNGDGNYDPDPHDPDSAGPGQGGWDANRVPKQWALLEEELRLAAEWERLVGRIRHMRNMAVALQEIAQEVGDDVLRCVRDQERLQVTRHLLERTRNN